ncbi:MAG: septum formation inhibitor Maf [Verrucomicrobiales bacterium]|nr:septum formation inhibitor Maf [Verrucomicrobiales bacterium]
MNLPSVILASGSPRRSELLRQLGVDFQVIPSSAIESESEHLSPGELCSLNAYRKARLVSKHHPDALVIGMDTVVALDSKVLGKPRDMDEAFAMMRSLQGQTHRVVTGVCLIHLRSHKQKIFAEQTIVTFRSLNEDQIREYYRHVNPLDKAGAYAIQENGDQIVSQVKGSFTNVVGLPMERLETELTAFESLVPIHA